MTHVLIELDAVGRGRVFVDGRELTRVTRIELQASVNAVPRVTIELLPSDLRVLAHADVRVEEGEPR